MKTICRYCGIEFEQTDEGRKRYCSKKCYSCAKAKRHYVRYGILGSRRVDDRFLCGFCGRSYKPTGRKQKYCSGECSASSQTRFLSIPECLESASRKLDKTIGYVRVYCPMHPKANGWGYVYEHRLIMEGIVGRLLTKEEQVHHINGKRWDNRPENLVLMSASDHSRLTSKNNRLSFLKNDNQNKSL